jgi:hypothetical protein
MAAIFVPANSVGHSAGTNSRSTNLATRGVGNRMCGNLSTAYPLSSMI